MRLRYKIAMSAAGVVAAAFAGLLFAVSHNSACGAAPALPAGAATMRAVVNRCYGPPDVVTLEEVAKPVPGDDQVLVKVRAASLNAGDWHSLRGEPYFIRPAATGMGRPTRPGLGMDYAGVVEAVGKNVTQFRPGDEVFGGRSGALTEYLSVAAQRSIAPKPANMSLEQAAAVPVAAITALQALRDHGRLAAGDKVLINGASGGVGTFAVQIAKAFGAEVTGVCSTRNLALVRELGADHVVDYTREDFTRGAQRYDLIVDLVDNHSPLDYARVLQPDGIVVIVGSASKDPWLGAFAAIFKPTLYAPFVSQELVFFVAQMNKQDLLVLTELIEAGKVKAVLDRTYGLDETRDALRYLEEGHVRGKVVVTFPP
jgi:NADPH:quinone reductase-like Zn-dependent oxidoreductase